MIKKFSWAVVLTLMISGTASAQSLDQLFKLATKVVETATGNNINSSTIVGTWTYYQPAIKLGSDNMLAQAGAAAITKSVSAKLSQYYAKVGIKEGSCTFTFAADSTFSAKLASRTISGSWSLSTENEKEIVTLTILNSTGYPLGKFNAQIYKSSGNLALAFPANKVLEFIKAIASKVNSNTANGIAAIAKNYDELAVGFEFSGNETGK
jgi:hypothetical protein